VAGRWLRRTSATRWGVVDGVARGEDDLGEDRVGG
jgi:hypothetical protein